VLWNWKTTTFRNVSSKAQLLQRRQQLPTPLVEALQVLQLLLAQLAHPTLLRMQFVLARQHSLCKQRLPLHQLRLLLAPPPSRVRLRRRGWMLRSFCSSAPLQLTQAPA